MWWFSFYENLPCIIVILLCSPFQESTVGERRQHMRILQILGDCYFAQYDYKTALTYYHEALDIGDKLSSSQSESEMSRSGSGESGAMISSSEDLDMALHNQLLSRSADAHISMKQYQSAVHYLEQARDIQDVMEEDIKGNVLFSLKVQLLRAPLVWHFQIRHFQIRRGCVQLIWKY